MQEEKKKKMGLFITRTTCSHPTEVGLGGDGEARPSSWAHNTIIELNKKRH